MPSTRISKQRFSLSPFTAETMKVIGEQVLTSVKERISKGITVEGAPAKPLRPTTHIDKNGQLARLIPYPQQKAKKGLQPIRDFRFTGKLMNSIQVVSASNDRAVIASNNPVKDAVLHKNNKISKLFGMAKSDQEVLQKAVRIALQDSLKIVSA